ncbi:MAG TPA: pilus assembly PilX N-terminal domain-containing protein [Candidatus Moranbacteria bacterium]|nr:pilus assembly PilX N-terminal domain-containing protein [Candidatus Moranbacteria bacterium]
MKNKNYKASALAVSLIILSVVLFIALSISLVSLKERKASVGSSKSGIAFQNADSGLEVVLNKIMNDNDIENVGDLCDSGILKGDNYQAEIKKENGDVINCSGDRNLGLSEIALLKSTGFNEDKTEQRAVETAVAAEEEGDVIFDDCKWVEGKSMDSGGVNCRFDEFGAVRGKDGEQFKGVMAGIQMHDKNNKFDVFCCRLKVK